MLQPSQLSHQARFLGIESKFQRILLGRHNSYFPSKLNQGTVKYFQKGLRQVKHKTFLCYDVMIYLVECPIKRLCIDLCITFLSQLIVVSIFLAVRGHVHGTFHMDTVLYLQPGGAFAHWICLRIVNFALVIISRNLGRHRNFISILKEDKGTLILQGQYRGCRWDRASAASVLI